MLEPHSTTTTTTTTTATTTTQSTTTTTTTANGSPDPSTTTTTTTTTTSSSGGSNVFPDKVVGMYILLADNTEAGYEDDSDWTPELYEYQQEGANVLFFTFIDPSTMEIPLAYQKLSATRGTGAPGAVPQDTLILYAIGGYLYSIDPNPWDWLTSQQKVNYILSILVL